MAKRTRKREDLIRVGRALIVRQGFHATGLSDILAKAEVPKGSFYYYFESKEDFGLAVIEDSAKSYRQKLDNTLGNQQLAPLARLSSYFQHGIAEMEANGLKEGCLFGNLAQEMSAQSPVFRDRIDQVFSDWEARMSECLDAAYQAKEISITPSAQLASFVLSGWQGAILRAKVANSTEPLHAFIQAVFEQVLKTSAPDLPAAQKSAAG